MNAPVAISFDVRVGQYVALRAKVKAIKDKHKEELTPYNTAMEQLEGLMLNALNATGQENAKTKNGTVYKTEKTSCSLEDADEFLRHVIGTEQWELLDRKANVTAVKDYLDMNGALPPGVKLTTTMEVGIRAPVKGK